MKAQLPLTQFLSDILICLYCNPEVGRQTVQGVLPSFLEEGKSLPLSLNVVVEVLRGPVPLRSLEQLSHYLSEFTLALVWAEQEELNSLLDLLSALAHAVRRGQVPCHEMDRSLRTVYMHSVNNLARLGNHARFALSAIQGGIR